MKNFLSSVRKTGRLSCAWVTTGNPKNPLACVWTDLASSLTATAAHSSPSDEVGSMLLCA